MTECPTTTTLSTWLDDELSAADSLSIRGHLEACSLCRDQVLGWIELARSLPSPALPAGEGAGEGTLAGCLDPETLVAYSDAELTGDEAARAEQHLETCASCVGEVQRLIRLRIAVGESTTAAQQPARALSPAAPIRWGARVQAWIESFGERFRPRWPALGALAATAVVILAVTRFVFLGDRPAEVQFRGVQDAPRVEIIADQVPGRARPGDGEPIVATLSRGTVAIRLEESAGWTRLQLADGRRVWVRSADVSRLEAPTR